MTTSPFTQAPVNPRRIDPGEFVVRIHGVRFQVGATFQEIELITHDDPATRVGSLVFPLAGILVPAWQWMKLAEAGIKVVFPNEDANKTGYAALNGEMMQPKQVYPVDFSIKFIWTFRNTTRRMAEIKEVIPMPKRPDPLPEQKSLDDAAPKQDATNLDPFGKPIDMSPEAVAARKAKADAAKAQLMAAQAERATSDADVSLDPDGTQSASEADAKLADDEATYHGHTIVLKSMPYAVENHLIREHKLSKETVGAAIFAALGMYLNAALDKLSPIQIWQKIEAYDAKMELNKSFPRNESPEDPQELAELLDDEPEPMTLVSMQLEIATIMKAAFPTFDKDANMDLFRAWTHCQSAKQAYEEIGAQNTIDIVKKAIEVERKKMVKAASDQNDNVKSAPQTTTDAPAAKSEPKNDNPTAETKAETTTMNELPESPFSANFRLLNALGVDVQFTIRSLTVNEGVKRVEQTIEVLLSHGYTIPAARSFAGNGASTSAPRPQASNNGTADCALIKVGRSYTGNKPQLQFEADGFEKPLTFTRDNLVSILANVNNPKTGRPFAANDLADGAKFGGAFVVEWSKREKDGKTFTDVVAVRNAA